MQSPNFQFLSSNVPGWLDTGIVIASIRQGALGILNLEGAGDPARSLAAVQQVAAFAGKPFAVKLSAQESESGSLLAELPEAAATIILTRPAADAFAELAAGVRAAGRGLWAEVTSAGEAERALLSGAQALIAKGQEAGGAVGEETSFVLLQRLVKSSPVPVYVLGGIGLHSAAACYVGGAAGVVLDHQLLLAKESTLPPAARAALERFEGDETLTIGREVDRFHRVYRRPGTKAVEAAQRLEQLGQAEAFDAALRAGLDWRSYDAGIWPLGQDAVLAAPLARRYGTVAGILDALRESVYTHVSAAKRTSALQPGSALAQNHATEFPILQGPMTRVSDSALFAAAVAEGGGLPFLALALLRGPQVRRLMLETRDLAGTRSWGVGILGFVPPELRAEQLEAVREIRPPFALIAGGRPDQAASLEAIGIPTYLHVPAPSLLKMFLEDGARRLIFEGRECGGHVGPRTSFVLWQAMIDTLLEWLDAGGKAEELHAVFAGGIHDAVSAAMVATMAAPLAERGVRLGVLLGTAYLFTEEAVRGGAIVETFQKEALGCRETVILESGPGHASRCVATGFYEQFREAKRKMRAEGRSAEEIKDALEALNLGRLRVASKGVERRQASDGRAEYVTLSTEQQLHEGMYMIGQVAALRDTTCTVRDLHEGVSAGSAQLLERLDVPFAPETAPSSCEAPCDVAIIGASCLLPGAAEVRSFWANVLEKANAIREVPKERFDAELYFDSDRKAQDRIYSRWGGFLEDVAFDPMRFGIPPSALPSIDPMQLLSLVAVESVLEDAGYGTRDFPRSKVSVLFGLSGGLGDLGIQYAIRSNLPEYLGELPEELKSRLPEWTEDSFAGILLNVAAGRVANRFDFGGVNFTVDAACASSLAATYLATRELTSRASDLVIVGGVDTVQSPFGFLCFSKSQALSPRGQCRPFDESADGIAISEGITVLALKRLADAERDGDRIYAVIKGIAGSSDGRGRSMTAPRPEGQKEVLRRAYAQAGFPAASCGYFEAHGTGTSVGDASEIASLADILREEGAAPQSCAVGSVKSMVGHTKSAAGVTGLLKIALALYHKTLPPTLHVEKPNAKLCDPAIPVYANVDARPWVRRSPDQPRRAGVSAFGFGGTNFHAALEEYRGEFRDPREIPAAESWPYELFFWTGEGPALTKQIAETLAALDAGTPFAQLAASVNARAGQAEGFRLAVVASGAEELRERLRTAREAIGAGKTKLSEKGTYLAPAVEFPGKVAFLFPGQGSQAPNMLRDLAVYFPEFRLALEKADAALAGRFPRPLSSYIFPVPAFTPEARTRQLQEITETSIAQPALGVMEAALVRLLERLGVSPAMTAGHSYGEYVALHAAGVLTEEALLELSAARGRAIREATEDGDSGTMAAVAASSSAVRKVLNGSASGITVANLNSPRQTIIAGAKDRIEKALAELQAAGLPAKAINVSCAFHSPLMEPAKHRLAAALAAQKYAEPAAAVYSNTLAKPYPGESSAIEKLLADHLVEPVRFIEQIEAMYEAGARVFLEAGPKSVLTGLAKQILEGREATFLAIDGAGRHGVAQLLECLAQLAVAGIPVEREQLFRGRAAYRAALETRAKAPAQWLINGSRAFLRSQPPQPKVPVRLAVPTPAPRTIDVKPQTTWTAPAPFPPITQRPGAAVPVLPAAQGKTEAVMLQFQQLMSQFLETQSQVMQSFLGETATPSGRLPQVPRPAVRSTARVTPPAVALPKTVTVTAPPAAVALSTTDAANRPRHLAMELVSLASERTGYPADVLSLDAAIEADLGIDSIKRVEILSAFQRRCSADEQTRVQGVMEQLTSARTLREIADRLQPLFATETPNAATPPKSAARNVLGELVVLAAERTGYPAEMLDVNAGIESDLGIDSIKRVEILSAFQRRCSADEQTRVQSVMEQLTSARTLREIADRLQPLFATETPNAATPPKSAARNVLGELVVLAAERTGYPAEMLDVNAGIESDLGIDSIKRVEILSAFQRRCSADEQTRVQGVMEKLTSARTLREIAEGIQSGFTGVASKATPAAAVPRFLLAPVDAPRGGTLRHYPRRVVLITDDETGLASAVAESWNRAGERALLVRHSAGPLLAAEGAYSTDLTRADAVAELLASVRAQHGPVGALIHLLPLAPAGGFAELSLDEWRALVRRDVRSLYLLAKGAEGDLKRTGPRGGALVAVVTGRGGEFGIHAGPDLAPTQFAAADFLKTLSLEFPDVLCKVVDVDTADPAPVLHRKLDEELACRDSLLQVGLPGARRLTVVPRLAELPAASSIPLARDSVILLTGGARGITAGIARTLAERVQPTLILAGASPLPAAEERDTASLAEPAMIKAALLARLRGEGKPVRPADVEAAYSRLQKAREIRRSLDEMAALGARVEYHSVDVRDEAAFGGLIDALYQRFGRLDAVIHGAGVIDDKLIKDKTPESFDRVVHTKTDSSYLLARKLRPEATRVLIFMSSITAALGNRAQADYAAANGVMNGIAALLAPQWGGRVVAMNWGPWDQAGMVSDEVRAQFLAAGVQLIPVPSGVEAVLREMAAGRSAGSLAVFGDGPWSKAETPEIGAATVAGGHV